MEKMRAQGEAVNMKGRVAALGEGRVKELGLD